jgi:hypothetical protein
MTEIKFENFDKLNRQPFAERLTKVITTFYPFSDGAYVLSLNASFGSGKTTFLQMWKTFLEERQFKVIYLNAWESDFDDEPLIPISTGLLEQIGNKDGASKKATKALQGIMGATALIGNSVLEKATGVDVQKILSAVEDDLKDGTLQKLGEDLSKAFFIKKNIYKELRDCLKVYLDQLPHKPLVILVDELDRVRPDYAVKFLEAIKHIFSIQGVCFILAVDREQLEASVKQLFGNVNFDNYYRRFITREANLPEASNVEWSSFIEQVGKEYFDRKETAGVIFLLTTNQRKMIQQFASELCGAFQLTPRQAEHMFRIFSQFIAVDNVQRAALDPWLRMGLFLIALMISGNIEIYQQLGKGILSPSRLYDFIYNLQFHGDGAADDRRYLLLDALSFALTSENKAFQEDAINVAISVDSPGNSHSDRSALLGHLVRRLNNSARLPHSISGFQTLYKKLEEWKDFLA